MGGGETAWILFSLLLEKWQTFLNMYQEKWVRRVFVCMPCNKSYTHYSCVLYLVSFLQGTVVIFITLWLDALVWHTPHSPLLTGLGIFSFGFICSHAFLPIRTRGCFWIIRDRVPSESIQTPWVIAHFVTAWIQNGLNRSFLTHLNTIPQND
jgi:hypothetical protein